MPEQRRAFRQGVLQVTLDDLKRVGATYLDPERASIAVISDADALAREPATSACRVMSGAGRCSERRCARNSPQRERESWRGLLSRFA